MNDERGEIMRRNHLLPYLIATTALPCCANAIAGGGPFGIDHEFAYDNSGIWKRSYQVDFLDLMIVGELAGGLWEGGDTRLGKTFWQAIDSSALAGISAQGLKYVFGRPRPSQGDNPNAWFKGTSYQSFPSGEVAAVSAIVQPFVFEYAKDNPAVYALELLPIYDGIARMKVQAHWQSDVLAGFALGGLTGYYSHSRESPFILGVLPHGISIGFQKQF
jgi:undecaprenyl-diphosphatase